jgi:hypothetical protein
VVSADALEKAAFNVSDAIATGTFGPLDGVAGRPRGWTIDVSSPGRRLWSVQLAIPLAGPVATGDAVLISFWARADRSPPEGVAGGIIAVENKTPGNPKLGMGGFTVDGEWRRIDGGGGLKAVADRRRRGRRRRRRKWQRQIDDGGGSKAAADRRQRRRRRQLTAAVAEMAAAAAD